MSLWEKIIIVALFLLTAYHLDNIESKVDYVATVTCRSSR